jgi:hypothetical protein
LRLAPQGLAAPLGRGRRLGSRIALVSFHSAMPRHPEFATRRPFGVRVPGGVGQPVGDQWCWQNPAVNTVDAEQTCRRCGRSVRSSRNQSEMFERMHYVCFHYEFEHDPADPDDDCGAAGCPSAPAARHKDRLLVAVQEGCDGLRIARDVSGTNRPSVQRRTHSHQLSGVLSSTGS